MTIEQRVAVLEEIFSKLQDYYTSAYSGEEIDARLASAGVPIGITKEYKSVTEMNQNFSTADVARGQFVLILPDSTASPDYGKVYLKGTANWVYAFTLTDLTAIKGPQGPAGKQGPAGPEGDKGADAPVITGFAIRPEDYHMIVTLSDGSTYDAGYCRGAPGSGTGDMEAAVYDPQGKRTDIFQFVAEAIAAIPTPDVSGQIQAHNEDAAAHPAIRTEIAEKSGKALSFAVTLTAAGWSGNAQTVSNSNFAASGYAYTVAPASGSFAAYASAVIYADDVTAEGKMTFHCSEKPTANLTVNILRVEVEA